MVRNIHHGFVLNNEVHKYFTRSSYNISHTIKQTNNLFIPIATTSNYGLKLTKVIGPKIYYHSIKMDNGMFMLFILVLCFLNSKKKITTY